MTMIEPLPPDERTRQSRHTSRSCRLQPGGLGIIVLVLMLIVLSALGRTPEQRLQPLEALTAGPTSTNYVDEPGKQAR